MCVCSVAHNPFHRAEELRVDNFQVVPTHQGSHWHLKSIFYENVLQVYAIIMLNVKNIARDKNNFVDANQVQFDKDTLQKMVLRDKSFITIHRIF